MKVYCGIDWAEDDHDAAHIDADGKLIAKQRISDDAAGFAALLHLLAEAGDSADDAIPVAIETSRGLLVACLSATGRKVFAINPMAVSRFRDPHSVAGEKSDAGVFIASNSGGVDTDTESAAVAQVARQDPAGLGGGPDDLRQSRGRIWRGGATARRLPPGVEPLGKRARADQCPIGLL